MGEGERPPAKTAAPASQAPDWLSEAAAAIYTRSAEEALIYGMPDFTENHDGTMWIPVETRGDAKQFFAAENGIAFIDVRAVKEYMRIDLDAIADLAHDVAGDPNYDEDYIAYTWEGYGWMWTPCKQGDARAVRFWRCDERRGE